jgi:cytoskeletal protein RodZ
MEFLTDRILASSPTACYDAAGILDHSITGGHMSARVMPAVPFALFILLIGGLAAQVTASSQSGSPASQSVVVGCLSQAADGFVLTSGPPGSASAHSRHGSNAPKSSTPITNDTANDGTDNGSGVQKTAAGSNSAKASTPVRAASVASTGGRTPAVMSAKGSVPIASGAASELKYTLDGDRGQLSQYKDHTVEVRGMILTGPSSAAAGRLKVERFRILSSVCTQ